MNSLQQAKKLIKKSENILVLPSQEKTLPSSQGRIGDIFCGSLSLFYTLKKLQKNANFLIEKVPSKFSFLVSPQQNFSKKFIISINTAESKISELHYEKNEKDLKIHFLLEDGEIKADDVAFSSYTPKKILDQKPDLLITVGAKNLQDLGGFFQKSPQFFYETPILNIDNNPINENFGEINLVEIVAPSLSEIVSCLIKSIDQTLLDQNVATPLLAGIISASQNFQSPQIRPKTFEIASFLLEKEADHQKIMKFLYKTKSISQIKLLGRVLEKLSLEQEKNFHFACLNEKDFQEAGASPKDLSFVVEELKLNFWKLPSLLLLWKTRTPKSSIKGVFYSPRPELISKILENFEGVSRGEGVLFLIPEGDLNLAKEKVLKIL